MSESLRASDTPRCSLHRSGRWPPLGVTALRGRGQRAVQPAAGIGVTFSDTSPSNCRASWTGTSAAPTTARRARFNRARKSDIGGRLPERGRPPDTRVIPFRSAPSARSVRPQPVGSQSPRRSITHEATDWRPNAEPESRDGGTCTSRSNRALPNDSSVVGGEHALSRSPPRHLPFARMVACVVAVSARGSAGSPAASGADGVLRRGRRGDAAVVDGRARRPTPRTARAVAVAGRRGVRPDRPECRASRWPSSRPTTVSMWRWRPDRAGCRRRSRSGSPATRRRSPRRPRCALSRTACSGSTTRSASTCPRALVDAIERDGYDATAITLRHLLQHTSGLYDYASDVDFQVQVLGEPSRRWTREEQVRLAMLEGDPLGEPGEVYAYSDTGYVLLGDVIERATGGTLGAAYRDLLRFDVLGLDSTWLEQVEPEPGRGARAGPAVLRGPGHVRRRSLVRPVRRRRAGVDGRRPRPLPAGAARRRGVRRAGHARHHARGAGDERGRRRGGRVCSAPTIPSSGAAGRMPGSGDRIAITCPEADVTIALSVFQASPDPPFDGVGLLADAVALVGAA